MWEDLMRFIHTADWHLGRLFHGVHLTDDQAYALDQLVGLAKEARVDAVLIAGDIYDRAIPPPEAVQLLDEVISRLVVNHHVPIVMIGGNHDSPDRLGFASKVLAGQRLHIFGPLSSEVNAVMLEDKAGPICVYAVPYAEPAVVRGQLASESVRDHNSAMQALLARIRQHQSVGRRTILVAHAFVIGGEECESERPLSVGGADAVDVTGFAGFDYVALGHLHRPQMVGHDHIQYAGSLLKYSFSEANHSKSVNLVDMGPDGQCTVERIRLSTRRDVRCLEGYLADLLQGPHAGENRDDYLMVSLLDTGAILDAPGKLRAVYPNVLNLERAILAGTRQIHTSRGDHRRMNDAELFAAFFHEVTGTALTGEQTSEYAAVVDAMRQHEREVVA
jgi:DNA repair protein SbcD/Mre11